MIDFTKLGGRTFFLVLGCAIVVSIMRWFNHLNDETFGMVISITVGAFVAKSSVDEHTKTRADVQKSIASKQAEASPPSTVEQVKD